MCIYKFLKTDDSSVGLYNNDVDDIYHSKTGALNESFQKFIYPSLLKEKLKNYENINILDICYGIGYNTKAALSCINGNSLNIDCLEYDSSLISISPFIFDSINDLNLKLFLISNLPDLSFSYKNLNKFRKEYNEFFDASISNFMDYLFDKGYISDGLPQNNSILHNIYYSYISNSEIYGLNDNKYKNCKIDFKIGDARNTIQNLNKLYDIVFLDAFSPQKDPTLWTIDFLSLVKSKMNYNSILLSYSKSTPFRSTLLKLGFSVGKTFINNLDMGTAASLNSLNIKNLLNDYDIALLNTRSGIPFKDSDLNLSGIEILNNRDIEIRNSNLISHTQFLKHYK